MRVEGTVSSLSNSVSGMTSKTKKKKQMTTVTLKVHMDWDGCACKMKNLLSSVKGAKSVEVDLKQQKVSVTGYVDAKKVLEAARSTKKKVEPWPYVPYTLVANPYVSQAYDKQAPPNHVRVVPVTAMINETTANNGYTSMFSDENPN